VQPAYQKLAEAITKDISLVSPETVVRIHITPAHNAWDFEEVFSSLHDFARNYPFDLENEDYLVHITTGSHVNQICLFLLTESRHIPGRLVQTSPPAKYRQRSGGSRDEPFFPQAPVGTYSIIDLDLSRYDKLATRFQHERVTATSFLKSGIDTRNFRFNALIDQIEHVAVGSTEPILLTGPTGAGKSKLARRIYELKKARRQVGGSFIEVNCATLRGDGAMSALFGHKRGSFTGALNDRPGLLRSADKGMIFLDEVGELGLDEQAMLLRAIEEKCFLPVGSDKEVASDFQVIAGTNRDLGIALRSGAFREDLLARLNLWTFRLPGLKERPEDIEPNLEYELDRFTQSNGRRVTFNTEARSRFLGFATSDKAAWSANFRDLSAAVTRMATLSVSGRITVELVHDEITRLEQAWSAVSTKSTESLLADLLPFEDGIGEPIDYFDQVQLIEVLKICKQYRTLSEAGRALFGASRAEKAKANDADRLRKYLARFGLEWKLLKEHWSRNLTSR